jgi:hypothetical protein
MPSVRVALGRRGGRAARRACHQLEPDVGHRGVAEAAKPGARLVDAEPRGGVGVLVDRGPQRRVEHDPPGRGGTCARRSCGHSRQRAHRGGCAPAARCAARGWSRPRRRVAAAARRSRPSIGARRRLTPRARPAGQQPPPAHVGRGQRSFTPLRGTLKRGMNASPRRGRRHPRQGVRPTPAPAR